MTPSMLLTAAAVVSLAGAALACDCATRKDGSAPPENALVPRVGPPPAAPPRPARTTLDDVLTPELMQSYLALQLHRAALEMAERTQASRSSGCTQSPCAAAAPLRRARRFAARIDSGDVPVVRGLVGLSEQGSRALPSASPFVAARPSKPRDDSDDVPVFKGTREGTPVVHLVSPPPVARLAPRTTTVPTVPVVKGSRDPAHPTTPRTALLPGDLQLTPEEEEALAVLLEGRNNNKHGDKPFRRPPGRPANWPSPPSSTPASVTSISGKVGGKSGTVSAQGAQPASRGKAGNPGNADKSGCCSQRRLVQELERQLALLRQLNADHMREDWVRASYPSPYYPYLHNLPVHSARGYEDGPMLVPSYYLASGWRRGDRGRDALLPPPSAWASGQRQPAPSNCDGAAATDLDDDDDGGHLDDKVQFSEQQQQQQQRREVDDLRGMDQHDDVGVDTKIGQPVDFEIRR